MAQAATAKAAAPSPLSPPALPTLQLQACVACAGRSSTVRFYSSHRCHSCGSAICTYKLCATQISAAAGRELWLCANCADGGAAARAITNAAHPNAPPKAAPVGARTSSAAVAGAVAGSAGVASAVSHANVSEHSLDVYAARHLDRAVDAVVGHTARYGLTRDVTALIVAYGRSRSLDASFDADCAALERALRPLSTTNLERENDFQFRIGRALICPGTSSNTGASARAPAPDPTAPKPSARGAAAGSKQLLRGGFAELIERANPLLLASASQLSRSAHASASAEAIAALRQWYSACSEWVQLFAYFRDSAAKDGSRVHNFWVSAAPQEATIAQLRLTFAVVDTGAAGVLPTPRSFARQSVQLQVADLIKLSSANGGASLPGDDDDDDDLDWE